MKRILRILMVVLSHYPNDPRVRREAEALVQAGYKVDVICLRSSNELKEEFCGGVGVIRILESRSKEKILQYIMFTLHFFWKSMKYINMLNSRNHYDLIQIHNMPDYLVFATLRQKINGVPVILDLHDIMNELFRSVWNKGIKKIILPFVALSEKISWNYADALITTSQGFKQCLMKRGIKEENITLILNTADEKIFNKPKTQLYQKITSPKLLYHGTVAERFGIHIVIEAISLLKEKHSSIQFDIYGNYQQSYKAKLYNLINNNSLEKNVHLHDFVSLEKIREIITESDFGVVPYLSDNFMDLALSTKTFEYVAMHLPVIASDIPSMHSIFNNDEVYFFNQGDINSLAETINKLTINSDSIGQKVINASRVYEKISWEKMSKKYINLIERYSNI